MCPLILLLATPLFFLSNYVPLFYPLLHILFRGWVDLGYLMCLLIIFYAFVGWSIITSWWALRIFLIFIYSSVFKLLVKTLNETRPDPVLGESALNMLHPHSLHWICFWGIFIVTLHLWSPSQLLGPIWTGLRVQMVWPAEQNPLPMFQILC